MTNASRAPVEPNFPPKLMSNAVSAVVKRLMKTPLRRSVGKQFMILHVIGRKTGRKYDIVVGRHEVGGRTVVSVGAQWRFNLRGGAEIDVTTDKGMQRARVTVVEDRMEMAAIFNDIVKQLGYQNAKYIALKVNVDRQPTDEEVEQALVDRWAAYFDFV